MALADIIRSGVAIANDVTRKGRLQETVSIRRWRGQDAYAAPTYATALSIECLVDRRRRRFRTAAGAETVSVATVTVLEAIPALSPAVSGRKEPVDPRDLVTLADGTVATVLGTDDGLTDPATARNYVTQIFLG